MGRHGGRARADLVRVSDPETLEAAVNAAGDSITEERLEGLIRSMPARLQAVINADGHLTPY